MLDTLKKLCSDPPKYIPLVLAQFQKKCAPYLAHSAFFIQGQMDIHPRSIWHNPEFCREIGGFFLPDDPIERKVIDLEPWDLVRRDMLILLLRSILEYAIEGEIAEVGVWKGNTAKLFHYYLPERNLHLFDTFGGFDRRDLTLEQTALSTRQKLKNRVDTISRSPIDGPRREPMMLTRSLRRCFYD